MARAAVLAAKAATVAMEKYMLIEGVLSW